MEVSFDPKINIIIGENGSHKSTLIDAIRLLYNLGKQQRDLYFTAEDFHYNTNISEISYDFKGLTNEQKGALIEYLVLAKNSEETARITLNYKYDNQRVLFSYSTGAIEGQKADSGTFDIFQHYFLGALRDSTKDLQSTKYNILGGLINRLIVKNSSENNFETLIADANNRLLDQPEVVKARGNINNNLNAIFQKYPENSIGLQIEKSKVDYIVNIIKPYLPFDKATLSGDGLRIWQNSLGFNNLIYIATILGDIEQRIENSLEHYALLIEEPEAHLHPQLQLSLYNFLCSTNSSENTQLFVTTHSPTLTSKVPLEKMIYLNQSTISLNIGNTFKDREKEGLKANGELIKSDVFLDRKRKLERYLDVTKSQLFYAKNLLLVEGMTEQLLIPSFAKTLNFNLEDYRIEMINVGGVSFYPFMTLFNSNEISKRLPMRASIITDDDRFTDSKNAEYKMENLISDPAKLNKLYEEIKKKHNLNRVKNIHEYSINNKSIYVGSAIKTLEFELAYFNIPTKIDDFGENLLHKFIYAYEPTKEKYKLFMKYISDNSENTYLSPEEKKRAALLLWKTFNGKAEFAYDLSIYILRNIGEAKEKLNIPRYILNGLKFLQD